MPEPSSARFYDELADDYHLIHSDWDASARRQGDVLDALIDRACATVLDCSCGIGTQAVGPALHGHSVTGTDISPAPSAAPPAAPSAKPPGGGCPCVRPPPTGAVCPSPTAGSTPSSAPTTRCPAS